MDEDGCVGRRDALYACTHTDVWQCVATCCSVLSVLRCVAACCSVLHLAMHALKNERTSSPHVNLTAYIQLRSELVDQTALSKDFAF